MFPFLFCSSTLIEGFFFHASAVFILWAHKFIMLLLLEISFFFCCSAFVVAFFRRHYIVFPQKKWFFWRNQNKWEKKRRTLPASKNSEYSRCWSWWSASVAPGRLVETAPKAEYRDKRGRKQNVMNGKLLQRDCWDTLLCYAQFVGILNANSKKKKTFHSQILFLISDLSG